VVLAWPPGSLSTENYYSNRCSSPLISNKSLMGEKPKQHFDFYAGKCSMLVNGSSFICAMRNDDQEGPQSVRLRQADSASKMGL
jgi:hypothetical protein